MSLVVAGKGDHAQKILYANAHANTAMLAQFNEPAFLNVTAQFMM